MTKVFIVEDNEDQLSSLILKVKLLGHKISGTCSNASNVIKMIKKKNPDIILLDINLNGDNEGLILAEQINAFSNAIIIFTTAITSIDIIKKAISCNPLSYLIKPISIDDLKVNITLARSKKNNDPQNITKNNDSRIKNTYLTVRIGYKLQKIDFLSIKFLEIDSKNYVTLTTINDKKVAIRNSLKVLNNKVLPDFFIQIHRQYVININYIEFINEREQMVQLGNQTHLPIGRTYKKELYQKLNLV